MFTRSGEKWTQQGEKLTGKEESGEGQFGFSVALSSNGNTALMGGPTDNKNAGAAWAFTRSGEKWTQQGEKLTGKEESGEGQFGFSVALSSNGNTALMGGPTDNKSAGAAWVFTHSGVTWGQLGSKLTGSGEVGEGQFGESVALSSEGNTALLGGFADNREVGAGWVMVNTAPAVETRAASPVAQTTATLNASVNPDGGNVEKCEFEYGETTAYGKTASCSSLPGSGTSAVAVSAALTGLTTNATYHFRISATNAAGTSKGSDETFKTLPNAPTVVTEKASSVAQSTATLNATVNPNGGNVEKCEFEYGETTAYGKTASCASLPGSGSSPVAVSAALTGLTPNIAYHFRISATNAGGTSKGSDETFKTLPNAPTVVTKAASSIAQTTATLNATVNPNGGEVTECTFEYGETKAYGSTIPCTPSKPGSGNSPVEVSAAVTGLRANNTYHFRISATNAGGTSKGSDEPLKTLASAPTVVTEKASSITQGTATLNASVNPNGINVEKCEFEYGETNAYGKTASCSSLPGAGENLIAVSASVTGLTANTTYHFRISATSSAGTNKGSDETFKTLPNAPTVVTEKASSIAQSTATLNATVNPNGGNVEKCEFEYGETTAYGRTASCASLPGSGSSPVAVSAAITGLTANATYHFRISATNAGGTSKGSDETFKTLPNAPTVVTRAATLIAQTTATLNATVNPNGGNVTKCEFEYGETTAYGKTASCASLPGSGTSAVEVSAAITGLTANATYHFRISATNGGGTSKGSDETFKTLPNAPTVVTRAATLIAQTTATLNATVNPNGGEVTECKFEYGETNAYGKTDSCSSLPGSGTSAVEVAESIELLAANTTYHFRISATNAGGTSKGSDETFKTLPNAPTVVTKAASSVTRTSATLNATVNPNGGEVTECEFEYGETKAYGSTVPCTPSKPGSGTSPVEVSASVTGLSPNTAYNFRISSTNAGGTSKGANARFVTNPPTVVTEKASPVTPTGATLNATVNPGGEEVSKCEFEYGETTAYGKTAPCSSSLPEVEYAVAVSASITSLTPNTTYHFRISATNPSGNSKGADETFKTLPNPPAVVTKAASEVKQTTATLSATVNPNGGNVEKCEFEYGESNAYGKTASCSSLPGSGTSPVAVSASVSGLTANTTYHFRISATNAGGTSSGSDETLKTPPNPPAVVTTAASEVKQTTATLNATVNPSGGNVEKCEFEYGETNSYGKTASCSSLPGSGTSPVAVSASVAGLTANTTYHFRISATNPSGTSKGSDETVKTLPNCNGEGYCATFTTPGNIEGSLKEPEALAVDPSGNTWVADSGHDRVIEFNSAHEYLRQFGSEGTAEGQFEGIRGIAANSEGDVYVSDYGNDRVQEFSPTGAFIRKFASKGTEKGQLLEPTGIAVDASGNVWVLSSFGIPVQEFSSTGAYISSFGTQGSGSGQIQGAAALAVSGGNLYISEWSNQRIQEFSTAGSFVRAFDEAGSGTGKSKLPWGIAAEPSTGDLYVSEVGNDRVQQFSPSGAFIAAFGSEGHGAGQLSQPKGIAVSSTGAIMIADTANNRIEQWSAGEPPAYKAAFTTPGNIEGSLKEPEALAVDPSGNTWVADSGHDRVIEFNSAHEYLRQFGSEGTAEGQFEGIRGIAANSEGDVYVSDYGNDRVQEFSPTGAFIRKFASKGTEKGQLLEPTGIAVDASGNVWVLSSFGIPVQEFSSTGAYISSFGTQGSGSGQIQGAAALAVSGGNLYISEWSNQRIQEFSTAGSFVRAFDEAGSGTGKSKLPWGIAAEPSTGDLYVSEVGNDRVQQFSPSGAFIAAFGSEGHGAGQLSQPKGIAVSSTGKVFVADTGNNRVQEWILP